MTPADLLRRVPLTPKLLLVTLLVGGAVWGVVDRVQSRELQALMEDHLHARLAEQAQQDRQRFDAYIASYHQAAKLLVAQKRMVDYVERGLGTRRSAPAVYTVSDIPRWLPDTSILRAFTPIDYAFLLDQHGRVRELYEGRPDPPPRTLYTPSLLLRDMSHNQSFLTSLDHKPFLLASEAVRDDNGVELATLMLADELDDAFLQQSQGASATQSVVALAAGTPLRIIASNRTDAVPDGTPLASLHHTYLVTGKSFFDFGGSALTVQFLSLVSRAEFKALGASILRGERRQRAFASLALLAAFGAIIFWISRHIRHLSRSILRFSADMLGTSGATSERGDELFLIAKQFGTLASEVLTARDALQREADEKLELQKQALVAERQKRELELLQALRLSEENYHAIFDSANDAIFVLDAPSGAILDVNQKVRELYGDPAEEAKGRGPGMFGPGLDLRDREAVREHLHRAAAGEPQLFELRTRDREGRLLWVEANIKQAMIGGNDRLLAVVRDVTERKQNEEALREVHIELNRRAVELELVNKDLTDFSYSVSHDLRAPLRSIEGFTRVILEDDADRLDATGRDAFARILAASRRMGQLIDALQHLARFTRRELLDKTVDLSAIVEATADTLRQKEPGRNVRFVIAPEVKAHGDAAMLQVVLENLVENAWKFTGKKPSATIEFGVEQQADGPAYFVRDDGAGFPPDFADKLFTPFRRLHTDQEFPGLGIGLAIAHRIILSHGGSMRAVSAPGHGATFSFTLGKAP